MHLRYVLVVICDIFVIVWIFVLIAHFAGNWKCMDVWILIFMGIIFNYVQASEKC